MPYLADKFIKSVCEILATKHEDFCRNAIRATSFIVFHLRCGKLGLFPGWRDVSLGVEG